MQAQEVAGRISSAVPGEDLHQAYQVTIINSHFLHLHYSIFASRFPLPTSKMFSEKHKNICLFLPSFRSLFCLPFVCLCARLLATMSEFEEVIVEYTSNNLEEKFESCALNNESFETETPTHLKTNIYHVGDGNIIGKNIIQELFDCTRVMPIGRESILQNRSCYVDPISMLVIKL